MFAEGEGTFAFWRGTGAGRETRMFSGMASMIYKKMLPFFFHTPFFLSSLPPVFFFSEEILRDV